VAARGDSKAKPPTSSGHVSWRWEGRGVEGPHVPRLLQGGSAHRSPARGCDNPRDIPLPLQGPSSGSSCYPPSPLTPKPLWDAPVPPQPCAEPWVASRCSQWDPRTQPLCPNLGADLAYLGPHRPQATATGQEPSWEAGGAGSPTPRLPGDGRHPGSPPSPAAAPPSQGGTPGVQAWDLPALWSPDAPVCPASPSQARCHLPSCSAAIFS